MAATATAGATGTAGEPRRFGRFEQALGALLVLNVIDAAFSLFWVESGIAGEANPLMADAMSAGALAFVGTKLALVSLGALLLWRVRHVRGARLALAPVALLYAFVGGSHLGHAVFQALARLPALAAWVSESCPTALIG